MKVNDDVTSTNPQAAIESIKILKARYFRYLDMKKWDLWKELFTPDAEMANRELRDAPLTGNKNIADTISANLEGVTTIHQGFMPEIELLGDDSARGVWAMQDTLIGSMSGEMEGFTKIEGFGHYFDDYVRDDGVWLIRRQELVRLYATKS